MKHKSGDKVFYEGRYYTFDYYHVGGIYAEIFTIGASISARVDRL